MTIKTVGKCSKSFKLFLVFLAGILLLASACSPRSNLGQLTAGSQDKKAMLRGVAQKYHRSLYWGAYDEAVSFAVPEIQHVLFQKLKTLYGSQKVVSIDVDGINFDDSGSMAEIDVSVRYYGTPSYLINSRKERQRWEFSRFNGGWQISDLNLVSAGKVENKKGADSRAKLGY